MPSLEIIKPLPVDNTEIKAVLFDFDGTISSLRRGWEEIMESLMVEKISGQQEITDKIRETVRAYINESTGIQTIFQMKWLSKKVEEYGLNPAAKGPWDYKSEYNERLLKKVNKRLKEIDEGKCDSNDFIIKGSREFLQELKLLGLKLYLASGTDHPDVVKEAEILGIRNYFEIIAGAPVDRIDSSKEKVIARLLGEEDFNPAQILVIGDGKVEISLGEQKGAITLGMATDEERGQGINDWKRERLIKAGAHAISGDFKDYDNILNWLQM